MERILETIMIVCLSAAAFSFAGKEEQRHE